MWPLVVVALGSFALAFLVLVVHIRTAQRWDEERRMYVSAAIAAQSSSDVASAIIRPKKKAEGPVERRPVQLDL